MNRTVTLPLKVSSSGLQRVNDGVGYEQDCNVTSRSVVIRIRPQKLCGNHLSKSWFIGFVYTRMYDKDFLLIGSRGSTHFHIQKYWF